MSTSGREYLKDDFVSSDVGKRKIDSEGSPVSGCRMDVSRAYVGVPELLQKVINENNTAAWTEILGKIDYIYANLDHALSGLDRETGFASKVQAQIKSGKKVLFKPNLVSAMVIDPTTHGEAGTATALTEWPLIAALMRWFHDRLDISYHQMSLGEAASATSLMAAIGSILSGKTIPTEVIFEGKNEEGYGGWGFFFVRKYLSDRHDPSHTDDPMRGYEDSVAGRFFTPGDAGDRLMVYDLNNLQDTSKGRTIAVPDGANYKEITLHKAIIGGDPDDPVDMQHYPGCVLVNVPKLKIHGQDLLTNVIKNLGIGLYPMQAPSGDGGSSPNTRWKYAYPFISVPFLKAGLPHIPWVVKWDEETHLPVKDEKGEYIATKTAGIDGTEVDIIRAVQAQNVYMVHVVDAIDMINLNHEGEPIARRVHEGYVWSSLDCVAVDVLCARYCFKTVGMREGLKLKEENGWPTEFVHHVPVARIDGKNITTGEGLDSPLWRYNQYNYAEKRGMGQQKYYVVGWDSLTGTPMASLAGHLGRIENGEFKELMTTETYYNPKTMLWDMQKTILSYAEAHDNLTQHSLTPTSLVKDFMDSFDENKDGIIDYSEKGRKGYDLLMMKMGSYVGTLPISGKYSVEKYGLLKWSFMMGTSVSLKFINKDWNPQGHDYAQEFALVFIATRAYNMSRSDVVSADPFVPGMTFGRGNWPSWQLATREFVTETIYGAQSPKNISLQSLYAIPSLYAMEYGAQLPQNFALQSLYGEAFQYADKTLNDGGYTGSTDLWTSKPDSIDKYLEDVRKGAKRLAFTLYVPKGYGSVESVMIPNVEETADPKKIFTAHFDNPTGPEVWSEV